MQSSLLSQLHDVHLPTPISWWPLAPGWYGVLVISLCIVWVVCLIVRKLARKIRRKKTLLQQFLDLRAQHNFSSAMVFIKQVAMNEDSNAIANLYGEAWVDYLQATGPTLQLTPKMTHALQRASYQETVPDSEALFAVLQTWLEQRL